MKIHPDYKFIVALNKTIEPGVALNATAHVSLSICAQASPEQKSLMSFIPYEDGNGFEHPSISALSLIVLRGRPIDLKKLHEAAQEKEILCADFIQTMTGGTYADQLEKTKETTDITYYAVALFGRKEEIDSLTKRLSLYS